MGPPTTQNSIVQNTPLGSKFLDPQYLFNNIVEFFRQLFHYIYIYRGEIINISNLILFVLAVFFISLIAYCAVRLFEIRAKERKHLEHEIAEYAHHQAERQKKIEIGEGVSKNEKWRAVLNHLLEANMSDWKLAILEADAMLDNLLDQLGFVGENMSDKLKSADPAKFRSLVTAWEVHTIRNRIAHEGGAFELSLHETKRVVALYEQIFREYGYI